MAGKRKTKNLKSPKKLDLKTLKAADVLCPICRTILIEPVTLTCTHAFCNACFKSTMENANLVCPLCRTRVGSWYRKAKKENKLVDEPFWSAIKHSFPQEVQNKHDGLDSGIEEDKPVIVVADPGEIRKEYEIELKKDEKQKRILQEAEEQASAALIKKIKEEEEYRLAVEEEKMRLDAELARKLTEELAPSTSKEKRAPKKSFRPLDKFLNSSETKSSKKLTTKEYSSGVLCLDKFPKHKQNGSKSLVMPVVQKKIQQIHKILETEERVINKQVSSSTQAKCSLTQLDSRYYFKPIEIFKKSRVDKKMPVKIPSQKVTVNGNTPILSPVGKKPKLENRLSAFSRFSFSEGNRPIISEVVETLASQKNSKEQKAKICATNSSLAKYSVIPNTEISKGIEVIEGEHEFSSKRSQNNNNLINSPQRKQHRRIYENKTFGSGDESPESPFLGFVKKNKTTNSIAKIHKLNDSLSTRRFRADLKSDELHKSYNKNNQSKAATENFDELNISLCSNSLDDSLSETFIGWAKDKAHRSGKTTSPKSSNGFYRNNKSKTANGNELNNSFGINALDDSLSETFWAKDQSTKTVDLKNAERTKPKKPTTFNRNKSKNPTGKSNDLTESFRTNPLDDFLSDTWPKNKAPLIKPKKSMTFDRSDESETSTVKCNDSFNLDPSDDQMPEAFIGWTKTKKTDSKSAKLNIYKKPTPKRNNKVKNSISRDLSLKIVDLTHSSESITLEQTLSQPFLGFESNRSNFTAGEMGTLDTSVTESFYGFNDSEKARPRSPLFQNIEPDVSPELSTSNVRQKRQPRTLKRNGISNHMINGLTPEKKRKLQKAEYEENERKRQEEADFELAKKLQSHFDNIATPKRTRRGTAKQVTLDEMLLV